jgi:hypothetical protein
MAWSGVAWRGMARLVLAWPGLAGQARYGDQTGGKARLDRYRSKNMQAHKSKTKPETTNISEPTGDRFQAILDILNIEDLIRFRCRLEKVGRKEMVKLLTEEIERRKALEKEEAEKEQRNADRVRSAQR